MPEKFEQPTSQQRENLNNPEQKYGNLHTEAQMQEMKEKLLDREHLPHIEELRSYFSALKEDSEEQKFWRSALGISKENGNQIYEIYTEEYIEGLARALIKRCENEGRPLTISEVGAGSGRLTHFLKKQFGEELDKLAKFIATDSGEWKVTPEFPEDTPVEKIDYKEALKRYQPDIVICSWMPPKEDWTPDFRATNSVKEYILIGPTDGTCGGDCPSWEWNGWDYDADKPNPAQYEKDGFDRDEPDYLGKVQFSKLDITKKSGAFGRPQSKTNFFIRRPEK